ncbi:28496_t:CDS:1, partial [Gigaspora margarita]
TTSAPIGIERGPVAMMAAPTAAPPATLPTKFVTSQTHLEAHFNH